MPIDTHDPTAALSQLATQVANVVKSFDAMQDSPDGALPPETERLRAMHERHAAELMATLEEIGGRPEASGAMTAAVHRAADADADWFGTGGAGAAVRIISGEERLLAAYDAALDGAASHADILELLRDQRAALRSRIDALRRS